MRTRLLLPAIAVCLLGLASLTRASEARAAAFKPMGACFACTGYDDCPDEGTQSAICTAMGCPNGLPGCSDGLPSCAPKAAIACNGGDS
jgi:hypothetical protein